MDTDAQQAQQVTRPPASLGFWAAVAVNAIVAVVFWFAVSREHGYEGVGDYYEDWLRPISVFLALVGVVASSRLLCGAGVGSASD